MPDHTPSPYPGSSDAAGHHPDRAGAQDGPTARVDDTAPYLPRVAPVQPVAGTSPTSDPGPVDHGVGYDADPPTLQLPAPDAGSHPTGDPAAGRPLASYPTPSEGATAAPTPGVGSLSSRPLFAPPSAPPAPPTPPARSSASVPPAVPPAVATSSAAGGYPPPPSAASPFGAPRRRRPKVAVVAATLIGTVAALGVGGVAGWAVGHQTSTTEASPVVPGDGSAVAPEVPGTMPEGMPDGFAGSEGDSWPGDSEMPGTDEFGGFGSGSGSATQSAATDEQEIGVLLIETTLSGGAGAGTGFVIDEDGTVVTNYHVVDGSTSIRVTVASTGETHSATVVGWNESADIAVLEVEGDPDLTPIRLDDDGVTVGEAVTTIGNSEGQGYLSAASGEITALEESITTTDELTGASNDLSGLLVNDVYAVSGDSGGPLVDAEGEVVGVTTATTSGGATRSYAVPIDDALVIIEQVESGVETGSTRIGPAAYLGVSVSGDAAGAAEIAGVVDGGPAARAGIAEGVVITGVDGESIDSADDLVATIGDHEPGESVRLTWTDASGQQRSATITLGESPIA